MAELDDKDMLDEATDLGEELDGAIEDMSCAVQAFTFDGDRSDAGPAHQSGEPLPPFSSFQISISGNRSP